ncbi:MAG: reverse transcriptase domain-containing protein [Candidatus Gracilibacteria bacterium]
MEPSPVLSAPDDVLIKKFLSLSLRRDIADLFEIEYGHLNFLLYAKNRVNYRKFFVPKKNGGKREINSPIYSLKILQKKLSYILNLVYHPKPSAHGFVQGRGILTNSTQHLNKNLVLNIDLKDYFPSINFGRIMGLFKAAPYNFDLEVAATLAHIACHNRKLPQGAPTSPILSNMICSSLDNKMYKFVKKYNCTYTRYADDLTISTNRIKFPIEIAEFDFTNFSLNIGSQFIEIIEKSGFEINFDKVRLSHKSKRQEVTGIIVNKFLNVKRILVKEVRAMLYAWEKYGLENAEREFKKKSNKNFQKVVSGKINYIKQVRGEKNFIYRKFINKYNNLSENGFAELPINLYEEIRDSIRVVKCGNNTGTGFIINGIGIVTCYHVVEYNGTNQIISFRCNNIFDKREMDLIIFDKEKDIAILRDKNPRSDNKSLFSCGRFVFKYNQNLTISGFPEYREGDQPRIMPVKVVGERTDRHGNKRYIFNLPPIHGESGGMVLNDQNEIVGMLATGIRIMPDRYETAEFGLIPIDDILILTKSLIKETAVYKIKKVEKK